MDWIFYGDKDDNGNPIPVSNFKPKVLSVVTVHTAGTAATKVCVKLQLEFGDDSKNAEVTVPLADIEHYDWFQQSGCVLATPHKWAKQRIAKLISDALPGAQTETIYACSRLGTNLIEGTYFYNCGDHIIGPRHEKEKMPVVEPAQSKYRLDYDPELSEEDAAAGMFELISLSMDAARVVTAYTTLNHMRHLYADVWRAPCFIPFVYAKSGSKKTRLISFLTQLHNRNDGIQSPLRFNSTMPAAVASLYEKSDCTIVFDDLFPSNSNGIRRKQEETLSEITRMIADGVPPARMRGKHVANEPPPNGVIGVGEYVFGTGSDAARLLTVELTLPDSERLKKFQDQPLLVSTFYRGFIKWYITNYAELREWLTELHDDYTKVRRDVHARLLEIHFFLDSAYAFMLQYCFEIGVISEQDAKELQRAFRRLLARLVREQQLRVDQSKLNTAEETDYLAQISTWYRSGKFRLASDADHFNDNLHDGVVHDGCLCLRKEQLSRLFPPGSLRTVIDALLRKDALKRGKDRIEIQIYATGGKRFYAIRLSMLR